MKGSERLKPLQLTAQGFEKLLENVLSMPHHAFYMFDYRRKRMVLGAPELAALYGYTLKEVLALPEQWASLVHPDDRAAHDLLIQELLNCEDDRIIAMKMRIRCKPGNWEWIACNRRPHERDAAGRVISEIGVVQIITRLVETGAALRASEARYRTIFEHAADAIWIVDQEGKILDANPEMCRRLGYTLEELTAMSVVDTVPPERKARARQILDSARQSKGGTFKGIHQRKDGSQLPVEFTMSPLLDGHQIVVERDITGRLLLEDAARQRDMFYRSLFHNNSAGVARFDQHFRLIEVNPTLAHMLDVFPEQLVHRSLYDIIAPGGRKALDRLLNAIVADNEYPSSLRLELRCAGRRVLHVHASLTAFYHVVETGIREFHEGIVILSDITDQRNAEQALRLSEERYARAMHGSSEGLWDWNIQTNETYLSPGWKALLGYKPLELDHYRDTFLSRVHPDDLATVHAAVKKHLEEGGVYDVEFRLLTKSGKYRWFRSRAQAERDENGVPTRMAGAISDIHERRIAEEEYKRELEFNQALVNHTSAFIVVLDGEGRIKHINHAVEKHFGYLLSEVAGLHAWAAGIMDVKESDRSRERFLRLLGGHDNPSTEVRMRAKNGVWHTVDISSTATRKADGSIDRVIVTGRDVTERNRLQNEVLKIAEQEQARIGHDLHDGVGQTMTGLASLLEALEASLTGSARKDAGRIRQLAQDAVQEVRRLSHGLSPAAVKNRGLGGALQLLAETVRTNFRTDCTCEVDESIALTDEEQQTHLYRIAQEAVNNALRHGKPQHVRLSLQRAGDSEAVLEIEDNGKGLKKLVVKRLQGIGMRVMEYRAHLISGQVQIQALPRGVRVTCRFPCEVPA